MKRGIINLFNRINCFLQPKLIFNKKEALSIKMHRGLKSRNFIREIFGYIRRFSNRNILENILKTDRGSYIVEASVILPIIIILMLTLAMSIKVFMINENIAFASVDEARKSMLTSFVNKIYLVYENKLEDRIKKENPGVSDADISTLSTHWRLAAKDNIVNRDIKYTIDLKVPVFKYDGYEGRVKAVYREFVGDTSKKLEFGFDNMEKEEANHIAYIFPYSGKKYHSKDCSHVKPNAIKTTLTKELKNKYDSCEVCNSDKAVIGSSVYYFKNYGEKYHIKGCNSIDKNIVAIDKRIAKKQGYDPCEKCKGGE